MQCEEGSVEIRVIEMEGRIGKFYNFTECLAVVEGIIQTDFLLDSIEFVTVKNKPAGMNHMLSIRGVILVGKQFAGD